MHTKVATNRTLLIVDDEERVLSSLSRLFRRDGYQVHFTSNPRQVMALIDRHRPQVIISDHQMPEMTGAELCSLVREFYPATYRLLLTGYVDAGAAAAAVGCGAVERVIAKPWDDGQLRQIVRDAFEVVAPQGTSAALSGAIS